MTFQLSTYLKLLLECQGESLVLLAGILGEERTLRVLEDRDDENDPTELGPELFALIEKAAADYEPPILGEDTNPLDDLERAADKIYRFPHFQFYIWSYPGYRKWVESEFGLDEGLKPTDDMIERLADDGLTEFHAWYRSLKIPAAIEDSCLQVISRPWKKLKHDLFRSTGLSPFRVV